MELVPLWLEEPSEELQGMGVDRLLGPGLRLSPGRRGSPVLSRASA
jgi:hypothetical protein